MLILDEPTNHLDIESREALVQALTTYSGAVILVSHDMHLLSLVADRLWLVSGGRVTPFDQDLAAYRDFLLGGAAPTKSSEKPKVKKPGRESAHCGPRRAEARRGAYRKNHRDAWKIARKTRGSKAL